jgi:hypothetical protein
MLRSAIAMPLTRDDLDLLSERFATKADLETSYPTKAYLDANYPTKAYLEENYPTKAYLEENYPTKAYLEENYPTKAYLEENYPTKAYLEENYPTKQDLAAALEPYATKQDLHELRTHMLVMFEDLKSWIKVLFDGMAARMDALEERTFGTLPNHEERIAGLELRVTRIERSRRRKQ